MTQNRNNVIRLSAKSEILDQDLMPYYAACAQRDRRRNEKAQQLQQEHDDTAERRQDAIMREMFKEGIQSGILVAITIFFILSFIFPVV